jgi:hypothetical protein
MLRVLVGLIKGGLVGGGIGYGIRHLGLGGGPISYLGCALVGAVVGVVAGRAPWRAETLWTPVVKMVVGALIGAGLCAAGLHLLPDRSFTLPEVGQVGLRSSEALALLAGVLYGVFVEVDDGGAAPAPVPAKERGGRGGQPPATRKRS